MKKIFFIIVLLSSISTFGQFKETNEQTINIKDGIFNKNPSGFLLSFLSSDNFAMNHSFAMSYSAMGREGVALGVYTNSMKFKFSENLNLEVDASLINSPYNTIGKDFSQSINGFYLSRAALSYKISEDMNIKMEYRQLPYSSYYSGYGYGYYSRRTFFSEDNLLFP